MQSMWIIESLLEGEGNEIGVPLMGAFLVLSICWRGTPVGSCLAGSTSVRACIWGGTWYMQYHGTELFSLVRCAYAIRQDYAPKTDILNIRACTVQ